MMPCTPGVACRLPAISEQYPSYNHHKNKPQRGRQDKNVAPARAQELATDPDDYYHLIISKFLQYNYQFF